MIDLLTAIKWVLACCRGYRLPETTRLAHQAAGGNLKPAVALQ
jgi:deoxyinosine 3'endonuclease (endonuclease V)